jgi:hypothetical protein
MALRPSATFAVLTPLDSVQAVWALPLGKARYRSNCFAL